MFWCGVRDETGTPADARLHDLRHSHASHAIMNGESLHMAGRLLGHRRAATTNRYAHLDDATLREAAERVALAVALKLYNTDHSACVGARQMLSGTDVVYELWAWQSAGPNKRRRLQPFKGLRSPLCAENEVNTILESNRMKRHTVLLGWGSLLWDTNEVFDVWHEPWQYDGPTLKLEFSRVSCSRGRALTLVIDPINGTNNSVFSALSRRSALDQVVEDLRKREKTKTYRSIGVFSREGEERGFDPESLSTIRGWANERGVHSVVWTDLPSNFAKKSRARIFS